MKYTIEFIQRYTYEIEADSEEEAVELAEEEFSYDMRSPIANTVWDELIVYNENDEEINHGYN